MSNGSATIVQRLWNYCNVLRDAGLSYGDYIEQLTYLLFLKMADERKKLQPEKAPDIPEGYDWASLLPLEGDALDIHYRKILETLGRESGMLGVIFRKAQSKIQNPALLKRLIADLIDREQWTTLDVDVKGDAYEGLLEKNAEDVKTGAGQYFTPRALIRVLVDVMRPGPDQTLHDPACGTGGFLLIAHEYISQHYELDADQKRHLRFEALTGDEIVDNTARVCVMNLYLHGIGGDECPIKVTDTLASPPSESYDIVMTNPPFGKKSSITVVNEAGEESKEAATYYRDDFWATTSNKQLNFLQHVKSLLKIHGRAAVVVPDNVLFEGGAGEIVRRKLLHECEVHTLLRLPTGIFYKQGVKANVLFFEKVAGGERIATDKLWVYDFRTNQNFTLRERPLKHADLDDFVACYGPRGRRNKRKESERFHAFGYDDLIKRDKVNLDIFWLKDDGHIDPDSLPPPDEIAAEIVENLETALEKFRNVAASLAKNRG
jgi:type I restriction enzyme M protein